MTAAGSMFGMIDDLLDNFPTLDLLKEEFCPDFDIYEDSCSSVSQPSSEDSGNFNSTVDFGDLGETFDFLINANDSKVILNDESEVSAGKTINPNYAADIMDIKMEEEGEGIDEMSGKVGNETLVKHTEVLPNVKMEGVKIEVTNDLENPAHSRLFPQFGNVMDLPRIGSYTKHLVQKTFGDHDYVSKVGLDSRTMVDKPATNSEPKMIYTDSRKITGSRTSSAKSSSNILVLSSSGMKKGTSRTLGVPGRGERTGSGHGSIRQVALRIPGVPGGGVRTVIRKIFTAPPLKQRQSLSILKTSRTGTVVSRPEVSRYGKAGSYSSLGGRVMKGNKCVSTSFPGNQRIGNHFMSCSQPQQVAGHVEVKRKKNQQERERRGQLARILQRSTHDLMLLSSLLMARCLFCRSTSKQGSSAENSCSCVDLLPGSIGQVKIQPVGRTTCQCQAQGEPLQYSQVRGVPDLCGTDGACVVGQF